MRPRERIETVIKRPDSGDFPGPLLPLFKLAFREANGLRAEFTTDNERALREGLGGNEAVRLIQAMAKDRPVGLALCFIRPDPAIGGDVLELQELVVLSAWRGRGIGSLLMKSVDALARDENCKKITLAVTVDNVVAQRLCRHLGFHHCHPPRYFMEKDLVSGDLAGSTV